MKQIIAIGGGGFSTEPDNPRLDQYVLDQADSDYPKICFIATASGDAENYILRFYRSFLRLRCKPTDLSLFRPPTKDLRSFLHEQDVIYVGGGNTKNLLAIWRTWNLDAYLREAWEAGIVLAGISAGSICWFEEGLSDYIPNELNKLSCLGFLTGSNCPHFDSEPNRRSEYHRLIEQGKILPGFAVEDGVALHFLDSKLQKAVSSRSEAGAYFVERVAGKIREESIQTEYLI